MMKLNKYSLDGWSTVLISIGLLFTVTQIVLVAVFGKSLPPQVPLFYSLPWGEGRLASPIWLWSLPALSAAVLIVNFGLSKLLSQPVLTRILSGGALLIALLALITLIKITILGLPWAYF